MCQNVPCLEYLGVSITASRMLLHSCKYVCLIIFHVIICDIIFWNIQIGKRFIMADIEYYIMNDSSDYSHYDI